MSNLHFTTPEDKLRLVAIEIKNNLYGMRNARDMMLDCILHGELEEAKRHDNRRWSYAETVRNIIQCRGDIGRKAYLEAREELSR